MSLKDVNTSEKILKSKCLVQEGFTIDGEVKVLEDHKEEAIKLINDFEELLQRNGRPLTLVKEVSDHFAGYTAFKLQKCVVCPECHLVF